MNLPEAAEALVDSSARDGLSPTGNANVHPDPGQPEVDETAREELVEKLRREREARAQALTLEIVGDLPFAEVKPPENVLFVCKLNPVTEGQAAPAAVLNPMC